MGAMITPQQFKEMEIRLYGKSKASQTIQNIALGLPVENESELQEQIISECRRRGWFAVYSGMHQQTSTPLGTPDFIIYADGGRVFTVETKSKTGKLRPEQLGVSMMLEKLGHKYCLCRSFTHFLEFVK